MKTCTNKGCKEINPQPLSSFAIKKRYKDNIYPQCNSCVNAKAKVYRTANPERYRAADKRHYDKNPAKHCHKSRLGRFKDKYWPDLSLKEIDVVWNSMFTEQKGLCSICEKPKPLEVEHCHRTGKVRSLACNGCNTALARIYEKVEIAEGLIKYIRKHNDETHSKGA